LIDDNGDGFLQKEEVIAAIKTMEENGMTIIDSSNLSPEEIAENMMKDVDTDGDGLIDIDEFVEMMKRNVTSEASGNTNSFISYNHRMSQLARNVLLAHQKKIENSIIGKDLWMIHPYSNFHVSWDIMVSLLIVLTVITMPLSIGWEELNREFFGLNLTVDLIFLLDIIKNFFTGIVDENDTVIMDHRIVRRQYLMGFFIVDFCSSIPLDLIFRLAGADDVVSTGGAVTGTKNSLRMLRLLRMAKLLRLFRVSRLANHVKNFFIWIEETLKIHISDGFTKMIRLMVGALVLGHWIGCFNFMLVRLYDFPEDSWVVYAGLHDKDPYTQWNWSFFKALAQMIMIGFETPPFTNASCDTTSHWCGIEHWITLGCLYIGAVFYSLLISSISSIIQTASLASRHFEEKLTQIDDYMRSKKLPASMREKVKDSFHLQHSNGKMFNENEILDMLSPILRREIKLFTGRDLTAKVPLLSTITNKSFAEEMSAAIDPFISFPNEVIIRENTMGHEMYFISSGVVEIFLPGSKSASYVAIGDGCFFGEVSLLLNTKRTASARTKTQCMLFKISKDRLLTVLKDFPDMLQTMIKVAESRRRRLMHYKNPGTYSLAKEDEIDSEDRKTELFGAEEERVVQEKDKEMMRVRNRSRHAGIKSGGLLLQRRH
jgi:CRP-like cAMP-binding protein